MGNKLPILRGVLWFVVGGYFFVYIAILFAPSIIVIFVFGFSFSQLFTTCWGLFVGLRCAASIWSSGIWEWIHILFSRWIICANL